MRDRYELFLGDRRVGTVVSSEQDFPSLWGTLELDPELSTSSASDATRMREFLALNLESTRLVDRDGETYESEKLAEVNRKLESFNDLIEADWLLIDAKGNRLPILCPILHHPNELVWRWRF